ncbi:MAG TPA: hypothetical protein VHV83_19755, partial [Armatimonadota bacterium]|nr:hypothetical protein [Armatimonadota bacterium]
TGAKAGKTFSLKPPRQQTESEFFQSFGKDGHSIVYGWGHGASNQYILIQEVYAMKPDRGGTPEHQKIGKIDLFECRYTADGKQLIYENGEADAPMGLYCKHLTTGKTIMLAAKKLIWARALTPDNKAIIYLADQY